MENEVYKEEEIYIPKLQTIKEAFMGQKNDQISKYSRNRSCITNLGLFSKSCINFKGDYTYDNDEIICDNKSNINKNKLHKLVETNSTTTINTVHCKFKKVTFSTVEIIRVQNYKLYNKINSVKKEEDNLAVDNQICNIY